MLNLIENLNKIEILLMSGISTALITHLFHRYKLKSEQKIRFQNIIGDRISKSLIELRELVKEASVIERYDIIFAEENEYKNTNAFEGTIYPAIMNDMSKLINFVEKINEIWYKNGSNLDCNTALYLWYASRYFTQLLIYIKENEYQNHLPELGTFLIFDIQKWHLLFDKALVKRINTPLNKIEQHHGRKWTRKKRKFIKMWEESLLYKSINGFHEEIPEINEFFFYLNELKNEKS